MFGKCATEFRRYVANMRGEKMDLFGGGSDLQSVADEIYGGIASAEYCSDHEPEPDKPERCSSCSGGTKP
jgi:hypothetical protein